MTWEKQESASIWLPKENGDTLEGEVVFVNPEGLYGVQYTIKNGADEFMTPSHKVLQSRMAKAKVGTKVKIVFKGEEVNKTKGQNPTKMYEVFFDE